LSPRYTLQLLKITEQPKGCTWMGFAVHRTHAGPDIRTSRPMLTPDRLPRTAAHRLPALIRDNSTLAFARILIAFATTSANLAGVQRVM
jgi:hypothetical protein